MIVSARASCLERDRLYVVVVSAMHAEPRRLDPVLVVVALPVLLVALVLLTPLVMSRWPPILLIHINMLLILYVGAGLATAARLKWDPSTYVVVRELLPAEYRVAAVALTVASFVLMFLAHLALLPLCIKSHRTALVLYITYAVLMCVVICLEVSWAAWTSTRIVAWLNSEEARKMAELGELRDHVQPILQILAKFHPLPDRINALIEEAMADAPRNLYVMCAALALLAVLQPAAAACALLAAAGLRRAPTPATRSSSMSPTEMEAAPLKAKYKNGKLVLM